MFTACGGTEVPKEKGVAARENIRMGTAASEYTRFSFDIPHLSRAGNPFLKGSYLSSAGLQTKGEVTLSYRLGMYKISPAAHAAEIADGL